MPARQNIILGDRIPRIISICVCVVAIFTLLTADYLQRHYVIGCCVSGSPFLIQHIGKVRNVECHLEFAATVFQHEDILRHMQVDPVFPRSRIGVTHGVRSTMFLCIAVAFDPFVKLPTVFFCLEVHLLQFVFSRDIKQ